MNMIPKILTRYIASQIIKVTVFVVLVMFGLYLFVSFISELGNIGQGNYDVWHAMRYVLYMMPLNLYQLFPMMSLLGSLIALGMLASHNEITVMRAAALSVGNISSVVLRVAVLMIIASGLVGEGFGPRLASSAEHQKVLAQNAGQAIQTQEGMWLRSDSHFIHVGNIIPGQRLEDVTDFKFNQDYQLNTTTYAPTAVRKGDVWYLQNAVTTQMHDEQVTSTKIPSLKWTVSINPNLFGFSNINAQDLSLYGLYHLVKFQKQNGLSPQQYDFTFWQRVFEPLSILVMIILAIPFIFGPLRSTTMGLRIVTGVIVGFSFFLLNRFLGPVSLVYQIPPLIAAALPILVFGILGLFLLSRTR